MDLVFVGMAIFALKTFGILSASFFTEFAVQVGSALEVTLLSLALGDKMNQVALDRERLHLTISAKTQDLVKGVNRRPDKRLKPKFKRTQGWKKNLLVAMSCRKEIRSCKKKMQGAAQQLIQADKLATLGTLVAGVAHDISNPIGLITLSRSGAYEAQASAAELIYALIGDGNDESLITVEKVEELFKTCENRLNDVTLGAERLEAISNAIRNQSRRDTSRELVFY